MMSILLVRHAQSTWNAQGRWQGQADPPLSELGRRQALAAAQAVGDVDAIVSSPQQRALQSAALLSNVLGVGPVQAVDGLQERSAGAFSGLTRDEIEDRYPGWLADGRRPPDYEPDDVVLGRVDAALRAVDETIGGGTALVVSHGGVIRAIENRAGVGGGRIPNLSGRLLTLDGPRITVGPLVELIEGDLATGGQPATDDPNTV